MLTKALRARNSATRPAGEYTATANGTAPTHSAGAGAARTLTFLPTGFASAECSLAIAPDGTIVVGPAFGTAGNGIIRSRDGGKSWELRVPSGGQRHRRIQPFTYIDQETGRLFTKNAQFDVRPLNVRGTGYDLHISDDLGETWTYQKRGERTRDWSKIYAGPPPAGDPDRRRITYFSGPAPFSTRIFGGLARATYQSVERSRDGGQTWEHTGRQGRLNLRPEREPGVRYFDHINYGNGVVGADGVVYLSGRLGLRVGVAVSRDAGETWTVNTIPGSRLRRYLGSLYYVTQYSNYLLPESVAVDENGTLFAVWPDHKNVLKAAVSRDQGASWSTPIIVSAPGVTDVRYTTVTAKPGSPGTFAIGYYGRNRNEGRGFHAYLGECSDVLAAAPQFVGGPINDPQEPLFPWGFDPGYLRIFFGHDLNEMLQARYAPDGSLYLACAMQMYGANKRHALSPASRERALQAVVGRLSVS